MTPNPLLSLLTALLLTFGLALLFWPQRGIVPRWRQARRATDRVLTEDALKHLYFCAIENRRPTIVSMAGRLQISENKVVQLLEDMQVHDLVTLRADTPHLTAAGREYALHIVRAHRLWERYLADNTGFSETQWHDRAEQIEHEMTPAEADALAAQLGYPSHDPHGDPIPTAAGEMAERFGLPLTAMRRGASVRITHLEDEPATVYAQLIAEGLYPGMEAQVLELTPKRVRFWADGDEHVLAPIVAANIAVQPLAAAVTPESGYSLADLAAGQQGRVTNLSPRCRGAERRRLLDLGIVPGTLVSAEMISPGGDPVAFRVRDTLIALRREQSELIGIEAPI